MDLKEEVRCDFVVSPLRKKVWEKQLEMLKIFIAICKKNHLRYYAASGTLLGAIRHKGYIPWDDDIDILMPRSDYDTFIMLAVNDLNCYYSLQVYQTEKLYPNGHAQIRDNKTTCFINTSYADLKRGKNCGIFIDIFPMDDVLDDYKKRQKYCKKIRRLRALACNYVYKNSNILKRTIVRFYFMFHSVQKTIEKIDRLSKRFQDQTHTLGLPTFAPCYEKNVWDKSLFEETIEWPFEDIMISIPLRYDEVLRVEYGDYMVIPENKTDGSIHGKCYFDCDKSYLEYQNISKEEFDKMFAEQKL